MSKNNPENRGKVTELRRYKGKKVKPVLFIQRGVGKYIAAMYEDGNLAIDAATKLPVKYANADVAA
ncbi:MAG: hypothetical protein JO089_08165 [Alphaproteobacteria bacterium]|nr:hypothetical protein [Alphaproteobacteria bacterium]